MSGYKIVWEADAKRIAKSVRDDVAEAVLDGADGLAAAPVTLSRPGVEENWPYYSQDQRYAFDAGDVRITLFFQYAADEQHLHITDVSVLPRPSE